MEDKQDEFRKINENGEAVTPVELSDEVLQKINGGFWAPDAVEWLVNRWQRLAAQQYMGEEKLYQVLEWGNAQGGALGIQALIAVLKEYGFEPRKVL